MIEVSVHNNAMRNTLSANDKTEMWELQFTDAEETQEQKDLCDKERGGESFRKIKKINVKVKLNIRNK